MSGRNNFSNDCLVHFVHNVIRGVERKRPSSVSLLIEIRAPKIYSSITQYFGDKKLQVESGERFSGSSLFLAKSRKYETPGGGAKSLLPPLSSRLAFRIVYQSRSTSSLLLE
jgi:hypothetical protein